ncbi:MAG TPA: Ig-like domain-containing protein [Candidatus Saccharimonadales bacterium]
MNRLSMTVVDRWSLKRLVTVFAALVLVAAGYFTFTTSQASAAACSVPTTDYGSATATINVETTANYRIWSRIMAADATNNSYLLEVDGNTCYTVGDSNNLQAGVWTWVDYQNGSSTSTKIEQNLSAGNHTIKMIGREAGVKLGRVLFVSDTACVPTGTGDNCAVAGDTEVPAISIKSPAAGASISGTTTITADATDNVGVTKVEFYINGTLRSTSTTSPYSYGWDSRTVSNGSAVLMIKAYDAAGNSNTDTIQVTVSNGDVQAPSVPTGVTATADAANKVTIKWSASTDNTGVTGYWLARNGQVVAKVTSGAQYVDQTVLPATAYSYTVSAFDAAGNTSASSAEAKVTTPAAPDTQAPTVPAGLTATAVSSTQINLAWNTSTDNIAVAAYDVYRSVAGGTASKIATVTTTSFGDTGLAASTSYAYYVTARDAAGNVSPNSTTVSAQTQAQPPTGQGKGSIKGRVTYTPNREKHAHVIITVEGSRRTYDTDVYGNYLITDVPAGIYKVRYEAQGSYSKVVTLTVIADQTTTQNVTLRRR